MRFARQLRVGGGNDRTVRIAIAVVIAVVQAQESIRLVRLMKIGFDVRRLMNSKAMVQTNYAFLILLQRRRESGV